MYAYMVICTVILHLIALLLIIEEIRCRIENKKIVAENAAKIAAYKEELKLAEPVWQEWAKKHESLENAYQKESDLHKRLRINSEMIRHSQDSCYYFTSIGKKKSLSLLAQENKWILQEESAKSA